MAIVIDSDSFEEIASIIGYPKVPLFPNKEWYLKNAVTPALREYFKWFPIKEEETRKVGVGNFSIDFPDETTFGIADARAIDGHTNNFNTLNNPWSLFTQTVKLQGKTDKLFSGRQETQNLYYETYVRSMSNRTRAFRVRVDKHGKRVWGNSNEDLRVNITWIKFSEDWGDIHFNQLNNAIELAQAFLCERQYNIRAQFEHDSTITISNEVLKEKADRKLEIIDEWQQLAKVVGLKG